MTIRRATAADIPQIDELLRQVLEVHHAGRPDLFKGGVKKYTDEELKAILANDQTPVFVAVAPSANDGNDAEHNADSPATDQVLGYAFCVFQQHLNSNILTDIKTLYIDDLCVDERSRGHHVGSTLYRYVLDFARQSGCQLSCCQLEKHIPLKSSEIREPQKKRNADCRKNDYVDGIFHQIFTLC